MGTETKTAQTTAKTVTKKPATKAVKAVEEPKNAEELMEQQAQNRVKDLNEDYVYMEKSLALLELGFSTGTNVIQYGPGGHGKSEFSEDFLAGKGINNPFVITMGAGMTTDRLFGGMDLKVFNDTGRIEYLVENSWMNHEYVICLPL